jgi:hypothetical protein
MHIPAASLSEVPDRASFAAERRVVARRDGCVDTGRRHAGSRRGGTLPHTRRRKTYCPDRIGRRCSPTRCSPGSYTAGSSPAAFAPRAPTTLDSAGLHGAKCRCGGSPPQASHRWRPGGFDRFPGLLCLGVGLKLKRESFSAADRAKSAEENGCRSFCRRWRQAAIDYVVNDINNPKMTSNPLSSHRWPNRAFPQNHADLDPHPQGAFPGSPLPGNPCPNPMKRSISSSSARPERGRVR